MFERFPPSQAPGTPPDKSSRYARPSLAQYAQNILLEAGIADFATRNRVFRGDPGVPVTVARRAGGGGFEYKCTAEERASLSSQWLIFEKLPHPEGDYLRARLFNSFAGASAEFAAKLTLQHAGDVTVRELERDLEGQHRGRHAYISYEGIGPAGMSLMMMGPAAKTLDRAARQFLR